MKLPPLPKPTGLSFDASQSPVEMWTASDLDAYGKACALAALEEAAKVCDNHWYSAWSMQDAIRDLRTELENTK